MRARRNSRPLLALAAAGLATLAAGVWRLSRAPGPDAEQLSAPQVATPPTQGPAPARVAGSGTWTKEAPSRTSAPTEAPCAGCDVVVVTMCSVRRDHLGPYSEGESLTPRLDALMQGAFRFDDAWSASPFTLASLTAVLTGRYGSSTGVTSWDKGLVTDVPTLPEILGIYGYRTGGFTIDAPSGFRPDYGLDRGFQTMTILPPPRDTPDGRQLGGAIGPGGASARPVAAWIAQQDRSAPIFAMFHTRTAHYPFVLEDDPTDTTGVTHLLWDSGNNGARGKAMPGTAGGTAQRGVVAIAGQDPVQVGVQAAGEAGLAMWKQRYRESIARMDADFGVLADALAARGRLDRTVLVVVADHGESLGDHGELLHGDGYFDGVVHVPLLVKIPGREGRPVQALASQVDLLPTILELVGAKAPAGIDGSSLNPVIAGDKDAVRAMTLVEGGVSWHADGKARGAVITQDWAMLRQDRGCGEGPRAPGSSPSCLFDRKADPGQDNDVSTTHADVVADLTGRWDAFRAARGGTTAAKVPLDAAAVKELQRTGYDFTPGTPR